MKEIKPVIFPLNLGTAIYLNCVGADNFSTSVTIYYQLTSAENATLQAGNLNMDGEDYKSYNTSANGNDFIYNWSANQLGVILI